MKIRITQTFATRVKPPAKSKSRIHYDSEIAGFGLRVTEKGAKSFVLNYLIHGRERRYTIGSLGEYTAETARDKAIELRRQIRDGVDPFAVLEQRKQEALAAEARQRTLKQLADAYLEKWAVPTAVHYFQSAHRLLGHHVHPREGMRPITWQLQSDSTLPRGPSRIAPQCTQNNPGDFRRLEAAKNLLWITGRRKPPCGAQVLRRCAQVRG
jgi:hypothetical protein